MALLGVQFVPSLALVAVVANLGRVGEVEYPLVGGHDHLRRLRPKLDHGRGRVVPPGEGDIHANDGALRVARLPGVIALRIVLAQHRDRGGVLAGDPRRDRATVGILPGRKAAPIVWPAGALKVDVWWHEVPRAALGDLNVVDYLPLIAAGIAVRDGGYRRGRRGVGALVVPAAAVVHGDRRDRTVLVHGAGDVIAAPAAAFERDRRRGGVTLTPGHHGDVADGVAPVRHDHRAVQQLHRIRIREKRALAAVPVDDELRARADRARAPRRVLARRRGGSEDGRHADDLGARDVTHAAANLAYDVGDVVLFVSPASIRGVDPAEPALEVLGREEVGAGDDNLGVPREGPARGPDAELVRLDVCHRRSLILVSPDGVRTLVELFAVVGDANAARRRSDLLVAPSRDLVRRGLARDLGVIDPRGGDPIRFGDLVHPRR